MIFLQLWILLEMLVLFFFFKGFFKVIAQIIFFNLYSLKAFFDIAKWPI